jgi:acyl-coenzyme A thioesterase PaaI-like protein
MRLPFRPEYMGADVWGKSGKRAYSGPLVMGLADSAMYGCLHGVLGREIVAVIVTLTISFIRPAAAADLIAEVRIVRLGGRLAYLETHLYSGDDPEPVSHVTATYAVRRA